MAILSKGCKPNNLESSNSSIKLSFMNVRDLCLNFLESKFFLESNSPDILALCETNLDGSIDSGNFSVRGYLPSIRKDSVTQMHGLPIYVKGLLFCTGFVSRKHYKFLLMFSTGFTSLSVLLLFSLLITFFVLMHGFLFYFI